MQTRDKALIGVTGAVLAAAMIPGVLDAFKAWTTTCPYSSSFIKFAVLGTLGECVSMRIKTGRYVPKNMGLLTRALAWGILGIFIFIAFTIFANGAPQLLPTLGMGAAPSLNAPLSWGKVYAALCISLSMNLIFAPLLMLLHRISDMRIEDARGSLWLFLTMKLDMANSLRRLDWDSMWGFVLRKTILLFWVPAHTITFLLPSYLRIIFAAFLGVVLGMILAYANLMGKSGKS